MFYNILLMLHKKDLFLVKGFATLLLTTVLTLSICSCSAPQTKCHTADKTRVTVSIPPLLYFANEIGGDSIEATSLLDESADPETFQPGVNALRAVATSQVFATVGLLPFENALISNLTANNPELKVINMSEGVDLIRGTHTHRHDATESNEGEPDPHVWSSVRNARIIARNMLQALIEADPSHRDYFTERYSRLSERLDSLDSTIAQALDSLPSRSFAVWHPSLSYFARDYNLHQIAFNAENKETSSIRLRSQLDKAVLASPAAFFVPAGTGETQTATIAETLGLHPVTLHPMTSDWENEMIAISRSFKQKLMEKK